MNPTRSRVDLNNWLSFRTSARVLCRRQQTTATSALDAAIDMDTVAERLDQRGLEGAIVTARVSIREP